ALERAVADAHDQVDDERRSALLRAATKAAGSGPVRVLVERMLGSGDRGQRVLALEAAITMEHHTEEELAWWRTVSSRHDPGGGAAGGDTARASGSEARTARR